MTRRVGILGASGVTGGELLRLLADHPDVELAWASSRRFEGQPVTVAHPHLAGATELTFSAPEPVPELDVLLTATPHGATGARMSSLLHRAGTVIDLSSDFRLRDPAAYERTYGRAHPSPQLLAEAAYGLPELERDRIAKARLVAGPGCLATSAILALRPLAQAGLVGPGPVTLDGKIGSTASGPTGVFGRATRCARTRCVRTRRWATATRPRSSNRSSTAPSVRSGSPRTPPT